MPQITAEQLDEYRKETFRLGEGVYLHSKDDALQFVNERGFVYFWPIKGVIFPSLWTAVAGNRPVADAHDDPGHITWRWKDEMLDQRQWYYAAMHCARDMGSFPYISLKLERDLSPDEYAFP